MEFICGKYPKSSKSTNLSIFLKNQWITGLINVYFDPNDLLLYPNGHCCLLYEPFLHTLCIFFVDIYFFSFFKVPNDVYFIQHDAWRKILQVFFFHGTICATKPNFQPVELYLFEKSWRKVPWYKSSALNGQRLIFFQVIFSMVQFARAPWKWPNLSF